MSEPATAPAANPVRETFYAAQRRHRRAATALGAGAALGMVLMSAPIASLAFPAAFALVAAASNLVSIALPTPDIAAAFGAAFEAVSERPRPGPVAAFAALILAPGALVMAALYFRVRSVMRREGGAAFRVALGARAPDRACAEERETVRLVDEMSIAAGRRAPEVFFVDGANANVAAFDLGGATRPFVVIGRDCLDRCARPETAALAAEAAAIESIGDARAASVVSAALLAVDLSGALLAAPFDARSRARARSLLFSPASAGVDWLFEIDDIGAVRHPEKGWRVYAALPFLLAHATFTLVRFLVGLLFFSPLLSFLMRRRRFLADATAIELARQPEALARALTTLAAMEGASPRAAALFPANHVAPPRRADDALAESMAQMVRPHPPLGERLARIARLGAGDAPAPAKRLAATGWRKAAASALWTVAALLFLALYPLAAFVVVALTALSLMIGMLAAMALAGLTGLLRP